MSSTERGRDSGRLGKVADLLISYGKRPTQSTKPSEPTPPQPPEPTDTSHGALDTKYEAENQAMLEHYGAVEVAVVRNHKGEVLQAAAKFPDGTWDILYHASLNGPHETTYMSVHRGGRAKSRQLKHRTGRLRKARG
jgi:hypothetical protein